MESEWNLSRFLHEKNIVITSTLLHPCPQTCPSDGVVLHFGKADEGLLEQVKGITYSMQDFLGPRSWPNSPSEQVSTKAHQANKSQSAQSTVSRVQYAEELKSSSDNELYHCVIYLAPGDYHGFHSPTEWIVAHRRHFPGEMT